MGEPHIISNLTKRRAYLAGEITHVRRKLKQLRSERYTVDKMLRLLDAGINPDQIKGIHRHYRMDGFRHGEITRLTFVALRGATEPMSADLIADRIATTKGVERSSALLRKVRQNLVRLGREGKIIRSGVHRGRLWELVDGAAPQSS
jgi:hypothetical protein